MNKTVLQRQGQGRHNPIITIYSQLCLQTKRCRDCLGNLKTYEGTLFISEFFLFTDIFGAFMDGFINFIFRSLHASEVLLC